ncbi:MAG: hypothetical protein K1X91_09340 [Bacteriodetes bacterium]|nr:hypothetical protein [Bacteroidota bacterium]
MRYNTLIVAALVSLIIGACSSNKPSAQLADLLNRIHKGKVVRLDSICTKYIEYAPNITADGKRLYFISNRPGSYRTTDNSLSHDVWFCDVIDPTQVVFDKPKNADTLHLYGMQSLNTSVNEGVVSYCAATHELFITGCSRPDGNGDCDIYVCKQNSDGTWGKAENLGSTVNSIAWESQPSISSDGLMLYFVSNRTSTLPYKSGGSVSIWYSTYDTTTHQWSNAQRLDPVNIGLKNWAPFICADGKTLFFSSYNIARAGDLDYYVTERDSANNWLKPINVGSPLNTNDEDSFLSIPSSMDVIYFSRLFKDETTGKLTYDLYKLELPAKSSSLDKFRLP